MTKNRLKVGVDIDGVLVDTDASAYLRFCEKELGWKINYELFASTHSWRDAAGQHEQEAIGNSFEQFLASVEAAQQPIDGAHDALKRIGTVADIFLITARTKTVRRATEKFLQTHLPDIRYHEISMENLDNKAQRIIDFGIHFFIDDSYREISRILQHQDVRTKIIPFPAFHGAPNWQGLQDDRIHWLSAWENYRTDASLLQQAAIRKNAWEEIVQVVLQNVPV